ncbi:hypothetical protein P389DRAFT_88572 [Cystobasidium minutum MCA 4210]|uniref:uncharacterized protein n=1 Tax=Cystobasidium minutum MCA 4210 TaxID=1397322 RepID=UPI0034CD0BAB|eukprot:jgi/Rhomi1/88572/CE88571_18
MKTSWKAWLLSLLAVQSCMVEDVAGYIHQKRGVRDRHNLYGSRIQETSERIRKAQVNIHLAPRHYTRPGPSAIYTAPTTTSSSSTSLKTTSPTTRTTSTSSKTSCSTSTSVKTTVQTTSPCKTTSTSSKASSSPSTSVKTTSQTTSCKTTSTSSKTSSFPSTSAKTTSQTTSSPSTSTSSRSTSTLSTSVRTASSATSKSSTTSTKAGYTSMTSTSTRPSPTPDRDYSEWPWNGEDGEWPDETVGVGPGKLDDKCGGSLFFGSRGCIEGLWCMSANDFYSYCRSECGNEYDSQCGGTSWRCETCCAAPQKCVKESSSMSRCR